MWRTPGRTPGRDPPPPSATYARTCSAENIGERVETKIKLLQRRNAALRRKLQAYGESELSTSSDEVEEVEPARPPQQQPRQQQQHPEQQQPSFSSSSSSSEEDKPAPPQQQQSKPSAKRKLPSSPGAPAETPRKKKVKTKHLSPEEESEKGDSYVEEYGQYIFCPEGTAKMQENAVSKISRAKVFIKYLTLSWSQTTYWTWEFLFNIPLLKSYPAVLRKAGLAPTTIILYVGQAISFIEYFRATPPKHSRITSGQTVVVIRELRKLHKDLNRTVLGHQALVKQAKGKKLVPREDLARCQALARAKMPSLLEAIEKAPPRDPKTWYKFFGYLPAYLSSIYGHRTGVLTRMRVKEVRETVGDDQRGYLINGWPWSGGGAKCGTIRTPPPPLQGHPDKPIFLLISGPRSGEGPHPLLQDGLGGDGAQGSPINNGR
ncbi:hypothetical protein D5F01_LYC23905 [Larimichthys crocea]|uniref:Uncharacterized protein n=1 Tax=Larimichthys crocea TaxID=215358 RepID=A0A6G0HFT6_LARCR|nr:hypothetical protein D5F01_LYC23905 [Larimichthys crocea]